MPDVLSIQRTLRRIRADCLELEQILDGAGPEEEVHRFLIGRKWTLDAIAKIGSSIYTVSKPKLGSEYVPDIAIWTTFTGGSKFVFVELERPDMLLFNQKNDPSAGLIHAVTQCQQWDTWIRRNASYLEKSIPDIEDALITYKVVAGRRNLLTAKQREALQTLLRNLPNLEIMTYDRILDAGREVLNSSELSGLQVQVFSTSVYATGGEASPVLEGTPLSFWPQEKLIPSYCEDLRAGKRYTRWRALESLALLKSPAIEALSQLVDLFADADEDFRSHLVYVISRIAPSEAITKEFLLKALRDTSPMVRCESIAALTALATGDAEIVTILSKLLRDPDREVRLVILASLGTLGAYSGTWVAEITGHLSDTDKEIRLQAARTLAQIGPSAAPAASSLMDIAEREPDPSIRAVALEALGRIGSAAAAVVPRLAALLRDDEAMLRRSAVCSLGSIGAAAASATNDLIIALRNDPSPRVREDAARALGKIGPAAIAASTALLEASSGYNLILRDEAKSALEKIGHRSLQSEGTEYQGAPTKSIQDEVKS